MTFVKGSLGSQQICSNEKNRKQLNHVLRSFTLNIFKFNDTHHSRCSIKKKSCHECSQFLWVRSKMFGKISIPPQFTSPLGVVNIIYQVNIVIFIHKYSYFKRVICKTYAEKEMVKSFKKLPYWVIVFHWIAIFTPATAYISFSCEDQWYMRWSVHIAY